jgi:hypothetical protein
MQARTPRPWFAKARSDNGKTSNTSGNPHVRREMQLALKRKKHQCKTPSQLQAKQQAIKLIIQRRALKADKQRKLSVAASDLSTSSANYKLMSRRKRKRQR